MAFLKIESRGHTGQIRGLIVTGAGKRYVTWGDDKTIRVWSVEKQQEERKILGEIGYGKRGSINAVALDPEDRYLAAGAHMHELTHEDSAGVIRLYDFASGELLVPVAVADNYDIQSLAFSPDGRYLAAGSAHSQGMNRLDVWEVEALLGAASPALPEGIARQPAAQGPAAAYGTGGGPQHVEPAHSQEIRSNYAITMVRAGDDDLVVSSGHQEVVTYSLRRREVVHSYAREGAFFSFLAVSGQRLATTCGEFQSILVLDLELDLLEEIQSGVEPTGLAFSPDGRLLLAGAKHHSRAPRVRCEVYAADSGFSRIATFDRHPTPVQAVAFLDEETAITAGGPSSDTYYWNARTAEVEAEVRGTGQTVFAVGIENRRIAIGNVKEYHEDRNNYAPLEVSFDLDELELAELTPADLGGFRRARETWNGQRLYIDPQAGWNLYIKKEGYDFPVHRGGWYYPESYGFTDHGHVIYGTRVGEVHAYDNSGHRIAQLIGHSGEVWDLAVHGNRLVTGGVDQIVRLWNLDGLARGDAELYPMLHLFVSTEGEWVVWSKSGYYDASLNGDQHVGFHVNQGPDRPAIFYTVDRFLKAYYRPDVIRRILDTGSEKEALESLTISHQSCYAILPPTIRLSSEHPSQTSARTATLELEVTPAGEPAERVWVLHNGQVVWQTRDPRIADGTSLSVDVSLLPGTNVLEVLAESRFAKSPPTVVELEVDASGWEGLDAAKPVRHEKPTLFLLSIGVSRYEHSDDQLKNLQYAHDDASDLVAALQSQKGNVYGEVESKLLVSSEDEPGASSEAIRGALTWLEEAVARRQAYKADNNVISRDVTLVFLAGHGTRLAEDFYFLSRDAHVGALGETAVRMMEIGDVITALPTEVIFLADTCHAGKINKDLVEDPDPKELAKRLNALNDRAQVILAATKAGSPSYEPLFLGHGVFTKVMLDALELDRSMSVLQLSEFVSRNVKLITSRAGFGKGPQVPMLSIFGSLDDYAIKGDPARKAGRQQAKAAPPKPPPVRQATEGDTGPEAVSSNAGLGDRASEVFDELGSILKALDEVKRSLEELRTRVEGYRQDAAMGDEDVEPENTGGSGILG